MVEMLTLPNDILNNILYYCYACNNDKVVTRITKCINMGTENFNPSSQLTYYMNYGE